MKHRLSPAQATIASWPARILLVGLAVPAAALAGPVESTSSFSFQTLQQSMWGPNGPSVVDTGVLFVGPEWNTALPAAHAELPFGLTISTSAIPEVVRDFLGIPNSVTLGSTSKTSIDAFASTSGKIGFDFRAILDPGSVDASYSGQATLSALDAGVNASGLRSLMLTSSEVAPAAKLVTRSPQIDIESNFITKMNAAVGLDGKWVTRPALGEFPSGCPFTVTIVLVDIGVPCAFGGQTEQAINLDPSVHKATLINVDEKTQLLEFTNTGLTVLGLDLVDAAPDSGQVEVELDIAIDVLELVLLAAGGVGGVPIDVTATDQSDPKKPRKGKDVDPTDIVDVKVSLGDLTLYVPLLNTEGTGATGVQTSGQTNLARIDVDADLMASVLFPGVVPVLGAKAGIGIGPLTFISLEADLLDADVGALFLGGQDFSFKPELWQTLAFGEEVSFSLGNGIWQTGDTITTKVGTPILIEIDPFKDLAIVPTYFLGNESPNFTNLTRLLGQPVFEAEILRLDLDLIFPLPDPPALVAKNFFAPLGAPEPLVTLFDESFSLAGFESVEGEGFVIQALQAGTAPEPGSLGLLALGLALLAARRLRRLDRVAVSG
jgi:hypothetical protein